jgi:hypothetical protein
MTIHAQSMPLPRGNNSKPTPIDVGALLNEFKKLFSDQAAKVAQVVKDEEQAKDICAFKPMRVLIKKTLSLLNSQVQLANEKDAKVIF